MANDPFRIFYDGECPMCSREMRSLKRRITDGSVVFQDLHDPSFDPGSIGRSKDELMAQIHGAYADGRVITGVAVFREAYSRAGLGWLVSPTGWPVLKLLFDFLYRLFARNRMRIGKLLGRSEAGQKCDACERLNR